MDTSVTSTIDSAIVVIPLRALTGADETRYVVWEAVHQVLRSYRKHNGLERDGAGNVERTSSDLYDLFDNDARRLVDPVAAAQAY